MLYLKLILTVIFWGGAFIAARIAAPHAGPATLSLLRFALASVLLFWLLHRREGVHLPARSTFLSLFLISFAGIFAYNVFFFLGLQTVPASRASLIVNTNPVFIAVGAALIFKEKLSPQRIFGVCLAALGAFILLSRGDPRVLLQQGFDRGDLYMVICLACWVIYALLSKAALRAISPLAAVAWTCLIGTVLLLPVSMSEGFPASLRDFPTAVWTCSLYLAIFPTVIGFTWYYEAIQGLGAMRASVFITLAPVSAVLLGVLALGEPLSGSMLIGGGLSVAGTWLTNRS